MTPTEQALSGLTAEVRAMGERIEHANNMISIVDGKVEEVKDRVNSMPGRDSFLEDMDDKIDRQHKVCSDNTGKTIEAEVSKQLLKQAQSKRTSSSAIKVERITWWSSLNEKQRTSIITAVTGAIIALSTYLAAS